MGIHVARDKRDIITDCTYCRKTDREGFGFHYAYGYECCIKSAAQLQPMPLLLLLSQAVVIRAIR